MTQTTKPIWIVIFKSELGQKTQWVAAHSLEELLSFFNEDGKKKIEKIEKTNNEITYKY